MRVAAVPPAVSTCQVWYGRARVARFNMGPGRQNTVSWYNTVVSGRTKGVALLAPRHSIVDQEMRTAPLRCTSSFLFSIVAGKWIWFHLDLCLARLYLGTYGGYDIPKYSCSIVAILGQLRPHLLSCYWYADVTLRQHHHPLLSPASNSPLADRPKGGGGTHNAACAVGRLAYIGKCRYGILYLLEISSKSNCPCRVPSRATNVCTVYVTSNHETRRAYLYCERK